MECKFQVGQKVVCMVEEWCKDGQCAGEAYPAYLEVYTVRSITTDRRNRVGIRLVEIVNRPRRYRDSGGKMQEAAFTHEGFEPVRTTNIDVFKKLLNPTPADVARLSESPNRTREKAA